MKVDIGELYRCRHGKDFNRGSAVHPLDRVVDDLDVQMDSGYDIYYYGSFALVQFPKYCQVFCRALNVEPPRDFDLGSTQQAIPKTDFIDLAPET